MYTWKIASPEEFSRISDLFLASELGEGRGYNDIQRRISTPLLLKHLITFYRGDEFCGFVTIAFLSDEAEKHMDTAGIQAPDWRSGDNFWVVDYVASPKADGYKMLRLVTKDLRIKKARYFRQKFTEIREVRA